MMAKQKKKLVVKNCPQELCLYLYPEDKDMLKIDYKKIYGDILNTKKIFTELEKDYKILETIKIYDNGEVKVVEEDRQHIVECLGMNLQASEKFLERYANLYFWVKQNYYDVDEMKRGNLQEKKEEYLEKYIQLKQLVFDLIREAPIGFLYLSDYFKEG